MRNARGDARKTEFPFAAQRMLATRFRWGEERARERQRENRRRIEAGINRKKREKVKEKGNGDNRFNR